MRTVPSTSALLSAALINLLSVSALHAAGVEVVAGDGVRRLGWQTFDVPDGLPSAEIRDLIQDANAHIWMATMGGVCRYDGAVFTTYSLQDGLPSNHVLSLADVWGQIWIGTDRGLARISGNQIVDSTLAGRSIQALLVDGDRLWSGSDQGLFRVSKGPNSAPELVAAGQDVLSLSLYSGDLLIGTAAGLFRLESDGSLHRYHSELAGENIGVLLADGDRLWIGLGFESRNPGLLRVNARGMSRVGEQDGLPPGMAPNDLALDRKGRLWIATNGMGVLIYNRDTTQVVDVPDGLSHGWAESLLIDREGSVWVGTWGGLSRYDFEQFQTWTTRNGLAEDRVYSLEEAADGLIFASWGGGVSHYSADTMAVVFRPEGDGRYVRAIRRTGSWHWERTPLATCGRVPGPEAVLPFLARIS